MGGLCSHPVATAEQNASYAKINPIVTTLQSGCGGFVVYGKSAILAVGFPFYHNNGQSRSGLTKT